ncbi:hypothetical protein A458_21620 [Stutzerimonas stutzeri CCUG 29243]|uniref:Uncharacterized protein n=2 Tax=Stutzerimonas stutzeri TaxID=316 RepID=M2TWA2_STUST|nr:hypothetical protein A458_21620 [Stutzerimonas stutzeri CCUG 29243]EME01656.1 hypothetical protein B381_03032 [Stutzerimonas stutzeri NF13]
MGLREFNLCCFSVRRSLRAIVMLIFLCRTDLVIAIGAFFIMAMTSFGFGILIRMPFIFMLRSATMLAMRVARIGHGRTTAKK